MKNIFIVFTIFSITFNLNAQCIADAGEDKHSCPDDADANSIPIGGDPTADNGTAPYDYAWSIDPIEFGTGTGVFLHASDILDDTTIANPSIIYRMAADSITFYLTITDDANCSSTDSCKISFTNFSEHLLYHEYYINQGDSVYLNHTPNAGGGIGNLSYDWNPSHGLSDTTLPVGFWSKPDSSISYTLTITDAKGCKKTAGGPLYYIYVGIAEVEKVENNLVKIFPNPVNDILYIEADNNIQIHHIKLFNSQAQEIMFKKNMINQINLNDLPRGVYLVEIQFEHGVIKRKVIKK